LAVHVWKSGGPSTVTASAAWTLVSEKTLGNSRIQLWAGTDLGKKSSITLTAAAGTHHWGITRYHLNGVQATADKTINSSGTSTTADTGTTAAVAQNTEYLFAILA
jgi:hypothetical protein